MNANGGVAKEAARLNRELKDSQKERKKLERELKRKEKALTKDLWHIEECFDYLKNTVIPATAYARSNE